MLRKRPIKTAGKFLFPTTWNQCQNSYHLLWNFNHTPMLSREDIAFMYLEQLPFEPYPFQEEAILSWFSSALERWGYSKHYVGLVTGNRRENPDAPILVDRQAEQRYNQTYAKNT